MKSVMIRVGNFIDDDKIWDTNKLGREVRRFFEAIIFKILIFSDEIEDEM